MDTHRTAKALSIIGAARNSLSSFCMGSCGAKCCSTGKLFLKSKEECDALGIEWDPAQGYKTMDICKGCPKLDGSKCGIYLSRPGTCRDFPLFFRGETVIIASWCPGYSEGHLNRFISDLENEGFKVMIQ